MQHEAVLRGKVHELRWRVRLLVTQRWVFLGLFCGSLACLALVVANKLHWLPAPPEWLGGLLLAGALVGAIVGLTRRVTAMDAAQLADRRLDLRERLSSGLDFLSRGETDAMVTAQVADAAERSAQLRSAAVFPHRFPREARLFAVSLLVLLAAIYLPELAIFQGPQKVAERAALGREGEKLQALAKDPTRRRADRSADIERRVLQQMHNLGKDMKRGQVSKKQAMLRMDRLTRDIQKQQQQLALANSPKSLDRAAEQMKQSADAMKQQGNGDAAKALAEMAKSLEKKDLEAAAQQLKQLAEKLQSGKMSEAEAKAAAETLSKMAAAMKGTELDQAAKQLEQAAQPLKQIAQMPPGAQKQAALQQLMQQAAQSTSKAGGT
jgi:hypothetical protein